MRTLILSVTAKVTLIGGAGTAFCGPSLARETWYPTVVSVSTQETTVTNEASCKIYCGDQVIQSNFVDGTLSGSTGDSTDRVTGQVITEGSNVWAVWAGGDSGAVATLNVQGTKQVP